MDNLVADNEELDVTLSEEVQGANYNHDFDGNLSREAL